MDLDSFLLLFCVIKKKSYFVKLWTFEVWVFYKWKREKVRCRYESFELENFNWNQCSNGVLKKPVISCRSSQAINLR